MYSLEKSRRVKELEELEVQQAINTLNKYKKLVKTNNNFFFKLQKLFIK